MYKFVSKELKCIKVFIFGVFLAYTITIYITFVHLGTLMLTTTLQLILTSIVEILLYILLYLSVYLFLYECTRNTYSEQVQKVLRLENVVMSNVIVLLSLVLFVMALRS